MKTMLPLAALAAALLAAPVSAQTTPVRSQAVAYADLDLSSAGGVARLDLRIHRAAAEVCGKTADFDLAGRNAIKRCITDAKVAAAASRDRAVTAQTARPIRVATR